MSGATPISRRRTCAQRSWREPQAHRAHPDRARPEVAALADQPVPAGHQPAAIGFTAEERIALVHRTPEAQNANTSSTLARNHGVMVRNFPASSGEDWLRAG